MRHAVWATQEAFFTQPQRERERETRNRGFEESRVRVKNLLLNSVPAVTWDETGKFQKSVNDSLLLC